MTVPPADSPNSVPSDADTSSDRKSLRSSNGTGSAESDESVRASSDKAESQQTTQRKSKRSSEHHVNSISSVSFQGLLFTQWLTMINDNTFRWLVVGIGKNLLPNQAGVVLSAGLACFVLPYLLFASISGYLADRFSKRNVIICCKVAEIIIMALGIWAIHTQSFTFLLVVVALMGAQSALFAPSKRGAIPEILSPDQIAKANGWFGFSTVTATVIGMILGNWLADFTGPFGTKYLFISGIVLIGVASVGTIISFAIAPLRSANPSQPFPINAFSKTIEDLKSLYRHRDLFLVACGIVMFWSLAALAQLNIDQFANESGAFSQSERNPLLLSLVVGVACGSILAGVWSGGRIELGMLSMASAGIAIFAFLIATVGEAMFHQPTLVTWPLVWACLLLLLLGTSAGIFDIPLSSYIQYRSPAANRGAILSAVNFMVFTGILAAAPFFALLRTPYHPGSLERVTSKLLVSEPTQEDRLTIERRLTLMTRDWTQAYPQLVDATQPSNVESAGKTSERAMKSPLTQLSYASYQGSAPSNDSLDDSSIDIEDSTANETQEADDSPPGFADYLVGTDERLHDWMLAKLLWQELEYRRRLDDQRAKDIYLDLCDSHAALSPDDRKLVKAIYEQSGNLPLLTSRQIFMLIGLMATPIFLLVTWKLPQASARFTIWWWCQTWFQIQVRGLREIPDREPVVFMVNHDSTFHRLLILLVTARRIRTVTWRPKPESSLRKRWESFWGVIHVTGGPATQQQAIVEARQSLRNGSLLAVFPERGPDSSNKEESNPNELENSYPEELLKLLEGLKVPLQPVSMSRLEWLTQASSNSRFAAFSQIVRHLRTPVSIRFLTPQPKPESLRQLKRQ